MDRRGFLAFLIAAPVTKALPWNGIAKAIETFAPETSAAISLTLAEIIATTLRAHQDELIANITANNALLRRLQTRGHIKRFTGGEDIIH